MAKTRPARKTSKGRKKTARKKATAKKTKGKTKARTKRSSQRGKAKATGTAVLEVAEIDVIAEPGDVADDDEFPPDYGGSE